jgi:hypothetical protein
LLPRKKQIPILFSQKENTTMGGTFRSSEYISFVRFGGRTIKDGEATDTWDRNGVHKEIIGPK